MFALFYVLIMSPGVSIFRFAGLATMTQVKFVSASHVERVKSSLDMSGKSVCSLLSGSDCLVGQSVVPVIFVVMVGLDLKQDCVVFESGNSAVIHLQMKG